MESKIVNIEARMVIRSVSPTIFGKVVNRKMCIGDILKCMCHRAIVDEVMPDGSTIRLNMKNYHIDNVSAWYKEHPDFNNKVSLPQNEDHKVVKINNKQEDKSNNNYKNRDNRPNNHTSRLDNNTSKIDDKKETEEEKKN